ncbi:hypothetical protein PHYBOEH_012095 [Phytophthora boehmeriae]|uniref:Uncharacterized protein n=1 Tax=Phytophthora boehmeriae TaxID=109152 RepID=A0A8T1X1D9_9STRA|nr:hypothetical protein PHYBOEH_012095 [Phytophthora boehmeriae]
MTSTASPSVLTPSHTSVVALNGPSVSSSTSDPKCRARSASVPLHRLECVRVTKTLRRQGHRVYAVGVFLQRTEARRRLSDCVYSVSPTSKLSPEAMRAFMMAEREPDFTVERRLSAFRQLRAAVLQLVNSKEAHVKSCSDCQDLLGLLLSRQQQNWTVKLVFGGKERRFALLSAFLNDLLTLTASAEERTTSGSVAEEVDGEEKECGVRNRVAEMMQEFLKRSYQPSLGII